MGREIKRVAIDFNYPLGVVWKGFINPYDSQKCSLCDGSGLNPETKQIEDDWYDFAGTGRKWCYNITQNEVDALIKSNRLYDFTHRFTSGKGWKKIKPQPTVTAEMVNEWSKRGMGHDSFNRMVCVEARAATSLAAIGPTNPRTECAFAIAAPTTGRNNGGATVIAPRRPQCLLAPRSCRAVQRRWTKPPRSSGNR